MEHAGWRTRGYLPHRDDADAVLHVVFRLADALPRSQFEQVLGLPGDRRLDFAEATLDAGQGSRLLAAPKIARMVETALLHFDGARYELFAWCVMPTHVHVLAGQREGCPLSLVVHGWKSFTANRANAMLGRTGRFWAPEYFDRTMRDDGQVAATASYIEGNPVAAGLCRSSELWPWSSARRREIVGWEPAPRDAPCSAGILPATAPKATGRGKRAGWKPALRVAAG